MGFFAEFRQFAVKGNVVDMAVGIILGVAFGVVVQSLVADVLMPPVGLAVGDDDVGDLHWVLREGETPGPYADPAAAQAAGAVTLNYGAFVNHVLAFLIVAFVMFVFVRQVNRLRARQEDPKAPSLPSTKTCPECASSIPVAAKRCPQCTVVLSAG